MQGTVWSFDAATSAGDVVLDDGTLLGFSADAFAAGGLRLVRPGQRVRLVVDPATAEVSMITILTVAASPSGTTHQARRSLP